MAAEKKQDPKKGRYSNTYQIAGGPGVLALIMSLHRQVGLPQKPPRQIESETAVAFLRPMWDMVPMAEGFLSYVSCINGMTRINKEGTLWKLKGVILAFENNPRRNFEAVYDITKRTGKLFTN